jgi:Amt family ammonium transporter
MVIGMMGGFICFFATHYLKNKLKIDDSLDVFPVHGVGGMLGTLLAAVFISSDLGVFSGNGYAEGMALGSQLTIQIIGILATGIYTLVVTVMLMKVVGAITSGNRVSNEDEMTGLDITDHNEKGYSM